MDGLVSRIEGEKKKGMWGDEGKGGEREALVPVTHARTVRHRTHRSRQGNTEYAPACPMPLRMKLEAMAMNLS